MKYDARRFAKLAGFPELPNSQSRKRSLNEQKSSDMKQDDAKSKEEWKNMNINEMESYTSHMFEDDALDSEIDLSDEDAGMGYEDEMLDDEAGMELGYEGGMGGYDDDPMMDMELDLDSDFGGESDLDRSPMYEDEPMYEDYAIYEMDEEDSDEVLNEMDDEADDDIEINEQELFNEVKRIKKRKIVESHLKTIIQDELEEMIAEAEYGGSQWMYGKDKPKNSKIGQIIRGFPGIGFK